MPTKRFLEMTRKECESALRNGVRENIGGVYYHFIHYFEYKAGADAYAAACRKVGFFARVQHRESRAAWYSHPGWYRVLVRKR